MKANRPKGRPRLVESTHMAVKKCRHGTMMYNVNDSFIGRSLDLYGEWCDSEMFVLGQILNPADVVVDVGANIGTHAVYFASKVGAAGLVVAFEPQRLVFQTLCGNVALNGLTNVDCLRAAVGASRGQARFPSIDPRGKYNFGAVRASSDTGELVDVLPIDELGLARCALIKVDVEGMEASVIAGAKDTIRRCAPALFLENNAHDRSRELFDAIESVDYKAYWHIACYYNPRNFFGNGEDVFAQYQPEANVLCVPKRCAFEGLMPVEGPEDDWRKAVERVRAGRVAQATAG
jgi:FkbM family methyltransferase